MTATATETGWATALSTYRKNLIDKGIPESLAHEIVLHAAKSIHDGLLDIAGGGIDG